jgi:hypothetical protein
MSRFYADIQLSFFEVAACRLGAARHRRDSATLLRDLNARRKNCDVRAVLSAPALIRFVRFAEAKSRCRGWS